MRNASGSYRLDSLSGRFFRAAQFRLIDRAGTVVGRYGRTGTVKGSLRDRVLHANWHDEERCGWLAITFDETYRSFEGAYGVGDAPADPLDPGFHSGPRLSGVRAGRTHRPPGISDRRYMP